MLKYGKTWDIVTGDCLEELRKVPDESIDSVVTDPPYGLSFMGHGWDTFKGNKDYATWVEQWAAECLRILKPGGHLLAFSGTRTYHALAWGVESAGFEIRDMIEWLYLSGFPKSMDVSKQFDKMAGAEREVVENRVGGRIATDAPPDNTGSHIWTRNITSKDAITPLAKQWDGWGTALKPAHEPIVMARKPLSGTVCGNVEEHGTGAINVDGCRIGETGARNNGSKPREDGYAKNDIYGKYRPTERVDYGKGRFPANCITTESDEWYSRHFNVTPQEISKKATASDRGSDNVHPTVKPVSLMQWLIKLVTPAGGMLVDPFCGSGSTVVAATREGMRAFGIELNPDYAEMAKRRIVDDAPLFNFAP